MASLLMIGAAVVASRATNTKGEPIGGIDPAIEAELTPILELDPAGAA